jgi:hypothetical protein
MESLIELTEAELDAVAGGLPNGSFYFGSFNGYGSHDGNGYGNGSGNRAGLSANGNLEGNGYGNITIV